MTETAVGPHVWILDCAHWDDIRVYATEAAAKADGEKRVHESAARQPVTSFEWTPVPDDIDGLQELYGTVYGRSYPANMVVYRLPILDAPGSDGGHETP